MLSQISSAALMLILVALLFSPTDALPVCHPKPVEGCLQAPWTGPTRCGQAYQMYLDGLRFNCGARYHTGARRNFCVMRRECNKGTRAGPLDVTPPEKVREMMESTNQALGKYGITGKFSCCIGDACCSGDSGSCYIGGDPRHICAFAPSVFYYNNHVAGNSVWYDVEFEFDSMTDQDFEIKTALGDVISGNWSYIVKGGPPTQSIQ